MTERAAAMMWGAWIKRPGDTIGGWLRDRGLEPLRFETRKQAADAIVTTLVAYAHRLQCLVTGEPRELMTDERDALPMWTTYDHPPDFPDCFVARKRLTLPARATTRTTPAL